MVQRFARGLRVALVLALIAAPFVLLALAFQTQPSVRTAGPPDAAAAERAREVASGLRALLEDETPARRWTITEAQLNGALASAGRVIPGLSGRGSIGDAGAAIDVSFPVPKLSEALWLNLRFGLGASEQGIRVTEAQVGRLPLPPGLVVPVARLALDLGLGDGLGTTALAGIEAVRIDGRILEVALGHTSQERVALFEGVRDRLRDLSGGTDREAIYGYLDLYPYEVKRGVLPRTGSALPYLRHAVQAAFETSQRDDDAETIRAALYALALYCGDPRFGVAIGVALSDRLRGDSNRCKRTTLDAREDLRQHFVLSAGLYAASTGETAFGVGELKELLDSNEGGSGFSFDDIAADLAGARFAEVLLALPRSDWPAILAAIETEQDILPRIDDLPSGLSAAEFQARFGTVDSPEYQAMLEEIERRIAALPLYGSAPIN